MRLTPPQWSQTTTPPASTFSAETPIHPPHWLHRASTPPPAEDDALTSLTLPTPIMTVGRFRPSLEAMRRIELGVLLGSSSRSSWKLAPLGYMLLSLSTSVSVQTLCLISIVIILWGVIVARGGKPDMAGLGSAPRRVAPIASPLQLSLPRSFVQANPNYQSRRPVRAVYRGGSSEPPALRD